MLARHRTGRTARGSRDARVDVPQRADKARSLRVAGGRVKVLSRRGAESRRGPSGMVTVARGAAVGHFGMVTVAWEGPRASRARRPRRRRPGGAAEGRPDQATTTPRSG
ncbi:hypothetical protein GCM10010151_16400 [Actinoallomurus spadix]|uniref:Uncharacterized protein n=1 Tax=Actinoallomurus spadix TaxID=79912 RepID=A0ABN0W6T0_9ACTN